MSKLRVALVAFFAAFMVLPVGAGEGEWAATYTVSYGDSTIGELHRQVRWQPSGYRFSSRLEPKGMGRIFGGDTIQQSSSGTVDADGNPRPTSYVHINSGKQGKPRDFQFDWQVGVLKFSSGSLALTVGVQDELSQMLVLAQQLAGGAHEVTLQVFNGSKRRIYEYRYQVDGEEIAPGPLVDGVSETALLVTLTTSRGKYVTRCWLAPERDYLPIRIERTQIKKQRMVVMQLVAVE